MTAVLFSAMRNEAPFLLEWVAYHKAIGFERIVVVTNDCTDNTCEILDRLAQESEVEHIAQSVEPGVSPQESAVRIVNELGILKPDDWGIFLDADEFLNIKLGRGTIAELTAYLEEKNSIGMIINWRIFGDSHLDSFSGSYISDDYTLCDAGRVHTQFKTLFKKCDTTVGFSKFLHLCEIAAAQNEASDFTAPDGDAFDTEKWAVNRRHKKWLDSWIETGSSPAGSMPGGLENGHIAQINHYMVRDRYSFHLKGARGRGYTAQGFNGRHTAKNFENWNLNETTDRSILRWQTATQDMQSNLISKCGLEDVCLRTQTEYQQGYQEFVNSKFPMTFPPVVADFVQKTYEEAEVILEYGSGGSTLLAGRLGKPFLSVETDRDWQVSITREVDRIENRDLNSKVVWVDIGKTKEWGFPVNFEKYKSFWQYPLSVWTENPDFQPDTVLIDGRMRRACFLTVMAMTKKPVRVLFDDYMGRRFYREVECLVKPSEIVGRMAVFEIEPGQVTMEDFPKFIPWFFGIW